MGPLRPLFESNILILALNQRPSTYLDALLSRGEMLPISIITWMEVLVGSRVERDEHTRAFLGRFSKIDISAAIAERAVRLRRTMHLKLPDAIIYATALETGRTLVTLNSRDFPPGTEAVFIPPAD